MCNCPNETHEDDGWILGRCGEDPGELIEKITRLEAIIRKLPRIVANRLMSNDNGDVAKRLVMELRDGRDGGGWCLQAVVNQVGYAIGDASREDSEREKLKRMDAAIVGEFGPAVTDSERVAPAEYKPAMAISPGDTLEEIMDAAGLSVAEAADALNWGNVWLVDVIKGRRGINEDMAKDLGRVFDFPASFWLNLESNYRKALDRLKEGE